MLLQIWVYGNSFESFFVAVVNPNKESLEQWAVENGVFGDFSTIFENPKTNACILGELLRIAKEKKVFFNSFYTKRDLKCIKYN